ncbi:MAG: hypothetical protein CSA76_00245 [Spirochaetales bacterium]|nr:MAG: hypothetical protein CSA76_00245 [Spirochaetales bacterium]
MCNGKIKLWEAAAIAAEMSRGCPAERSKPEIHPRISELQRKARAAQKENTTKVCRLELQL